MVDPNFAELATHAVPGADGRLRWANPERPWAPTDFKPSRNADLAKLIAEFAVRHGVDAVLTPSHLIESVTGGWHTLDLQLCEWLRQELDRLGGREIAIDFLVVDAGAPLTDSTYDEMADTAIPIDFCLFRAASSTGAMTRHLIEASESFTSSRNIGCRLRRWVFRACHSRVGCRRDQSRGRAKRVLSRS